MTWRLSNPSMNTSHCGVRSTFVVAMTMTHAMTIKSRIADLPGTLP